MKITNYFNDEPFLFNGVFSKNNLPWIKDGVYVANLVERNSKGTHWVWLAVYIDSFRI